MRDYAWVHLLVQILNNPCDIVLFQASMTGSALSLYLEETKTNEDSMFQSEISPINKDGIHESKNQNNLNSSTEARDIPPGGKGDPCDLSPTTLALHKVELLYLGMPSENDSVH